MRSRSKRGSTSAIYSPVNEASVTVARSEPEPFTQRIRARRPRKSTSSALAEVLPPPQLQIERSAPSLRERATNCDSVVCGEVFFIEIGARDPGIHARGGKRRSFLKAGAQGNLCLLIR